MFIVLGATGHTGSVVAETLLAHGQPVRVVVRSIDKGAPWKAKGAEVVVATYDDTKTMHKAFEGTKRGYLLVPPNYQAKAWLAEQQRTMDQAAEAIKASGIPQGTGPIRAVRYGEQKLGSVAKNLTILRPCSFMENWAPVLGAAKDQGVLPTFLAPDVKIPMISTKDIGWVAAERLMAGGKGRRVVELAGPEEYSPADVAAALSRIFGRAVSAQSAPLSAVVPTLKSFGFSDEAATLFEEMYTAFSRGAVGYEHPDSLGRGRVTLAEALRAMV